VTHCRFRTVTQSTKHRILLCGRLKFAAPATDTAPERESDQQIASQIKHSAVGIGPGARVTEQEKFQWLS